METTDTFALPDRETHGSYRTYEEWKLVSSTANILHLDSGSYRTYEEWKRRK